MEITATREMSDLPWALQRGKVKERSGSTRLAEGTASKVSPAPRVDASPAAGAAVLSQISAVKDLVTDLLRETQLSKAPGVPEGLFDTYLKLVKGEVAQKIAGRLIEQVRDELGA